MTKLDQAATLRRARDGGITSIAPRRSRAVAITGGKGGVGKSTIAVNLAVAYAGLGARTVIVDGDLGMADLNLLLGVMPERSSRDVVLGSAVGDVLVAAHGIHLLPAQNGDFDLANLGQRDTHTLLDAVDGLAGRFDTLVVDLGAGLSAPQVSLAAAIPTVVLVTTSEPLALADAYACLKVLDRHYGLDCAYVLPNRVRSPDEADEVVGRLRALVARFLDLTLHALPAIPADPALALASSQGHPAVLAAPDAPASRSIRNVARRLDIATRDLDQPRPGSFLTRRTATRRTEQPR